MQREKHKGRFVYFSKRPEIYSRQKYARTSGRPGLGMPTDQEAVMILVELLKHPGAGIEELAARVSTAESMDAAGSRQSVFRTSRSGKKTSDARR